MLYRRNTDSKLRDLERQYATTQDKVLLKQIDNERRRSGMPPHPATRIAVAEDRLAENNYNCFMLIRDLQPNLDQLFQISEAVRLMPDIFNERQFIPEIQGILRIRNLAETDGMATLSGRPPSKNWITYLSERGITLPVQGDLPAKAIKNYSLAPHLERAGSSDRLSIANAVRDEADESCHDWLSMLVTLGLLNARDLLEVLGDEEETVELLLRIEDTLGNRNLILAELIQARIEGKPPSGYQEEIGDHYWWRHIS